VISHLQAQLVNGSFHQQECGEQQFCALQKKQPLQVAVLDTGLDKDYMDHPAFKGITVTARNFTTEDVGG
jgi:hypothetical protein